MENIVTTASRKCVPPLHVAPSSEHIVKRTVCLRSVFLRLP